MTVFTHSSTRQVRRTFVNSLGSSNSTEIISYVEMVRTMAEMASYHAQIGL
jgi:hypothetical protein